MGRRVATILILFCILTASSAATPPRTPDPTWLALDAYLEGNYDDGLARFGKPEDFLRQQSRLKTQAPRWIDAATLNERARRARVAATVALELVNNAAVAEIGRGGNREVWLTYMYQVLGFGSRLVAQGEPSEFERIWLLAELAIFQSMENYYSFGRYPPDEPHEHYGRELWTHARERFPSEPRLLLASIFPRTEVRRTPNRPGISATFMTIGVPYDTAAGVDHPALDVAPEYEPIAVTRVQASIDELTRVANVPGIAAEARLRRGMLLFHRSELSASLDDTRFAAAEAGEDTWVAYLAHLYSGLCLENLDRRSEALDEYQSALRLFPSAQSGVLVLSAALVMSDRRAEASALMERAVTQPAAPDPWREFSLGDYRFWSGYRTQLREALKP